MSTAPLQPNSTNLSPIQARPLTQTQTTQPTQKSVEAQDTFTADSSATAGAAVSVSVGAMPPGVSPEGFPHVNFVTDEKGNTAQVQFIYDTDQRKALSNLTLIGSWDNKGHYCTDWKDSAVPMKGKDDGTYVATVNLDASHPGQQYQWGVLADGPFGKQNLAMFGEAPPVFTAQPGLSTQTYAPRTYAQMGLTRQGEDARVKVWGGKATNMALQVWDQPGQQPRTIPLQVDADGYWQTRLPGQWKELEGKSYGFAVTADGQTVVHADPYARQLQGQLRGIGDVYLHPKTGQEVNKYFKTAVAVETPPADGAPSEAAPASVGPVHFQRFEVQQQGQADKVFLRLFGPDGAPLVRTDLEKRLGQQGADLVHKSQEGFWHDQCADDGRISLQRAGSDAWSVMVNNPEALQGLRYQFEVWGKDAQGKPALVGDSNHDGQLSVDEARRTSFNDPYDQRIENVGSQRLSVVRSDDFDWKHEQPKLDKKKVIIYQAHVGSFMGEARNTRRSTFKDLMDHLDYFKDLGVNTIELLPTNPFEGQRDWGYLGTSSTAAAEQYGFTDTDGRWVSGGEALKRFIDAAHGKGLAVMDDVVYNHFGGDYNNLWQFDGKANSYLNWGNGLKNTDWGPMPAYNQKADYQFVQDSAMAKLDEYRFDGLRFDFTNPMHTDGWGGGADGWRMLREVNRQIHFFHPTAITAAEEFPNSPIVTTPAGPNLAGGAGFDAMWNTEFQHRLVHDGSNPSVLQQAASGHQTNMDKFMGHLTDHPGFANDQSSVTVISNHDEVGNADRTINVARNYRGEGPSTAWERGVARATFAIGMLSPGMPMFFQGEESLADNTFKWGIPSTWDTGWSWNDKNFDWKSAGQALALQGDNPSSAAAAPPDKDVFRRLHFECCKQAIALRNSSPAFEADVPAQRVYTHNDNSVMAFTRQRGDDKFLVVASLNHNAQPNYNIPVEDGKWELLLNTDNRDFGGGGMGRATVGGGGQAQFDIPAGAVQVYRKVG